MNKTFALILLLVAALVVVCIPNESSDADGASVTEIQLGGLVYVITDPANHHVALEDVMNKSAETLSVPDTITFDGDEYKVVSLKGLNKTNTEDIEFLNIGKYVTEFLDVEKPEKVLPEMFDSLKSIKVSNENTVFSSSDDVLFMGTTLYLYPRDCEKTTYTIPATTTDIVRGSFAFADNLMALKVEQGNTAFVADSNGVLYNKDKTTLFAYPAGKEHSVPNIPDTVKRLEMYSFAGSDIERVSIPDSVVDFGNYVFCDSDLEEAVLGKGITQIDEGFFKECSSLDEIIIKGDMDSLTIEPFAFMDCDSDLRFESGRQGYDLRVYYDKGFTKEYQFALNAEDITLYLKWTKDPHAGGDGNGGMSMTAIIGIVVALVAILAVAGFLFMRKSA